MEIVAHSHEEVFMQESKKIKYQSWWWWLSMLKRRIIYTCLWASLFELTHNLMLNERWYFLYIYFLLFLLLYFVVLLNTLFESILPYILFLYTHHIHLLLKFMNKTIRNDVEKKWKNEIENCDFFVNFSERENCDEWETRVCAKKNLKLRVEASRWQNGN